MNISIRQISVFEATARLKRITVAADALAITQSAASQSLKELESALGYSLFNRVGRELVINDNGLGLLPKALEILSLIDELKNPFSGEVKGRLHVVSSVTIASYLMPKLLAEFIDLYPGVEPELQIANTDEVISLVERGQAQLGLIEGPCGQTTLRVSPWITDHLDVFCHHQHPLAAKAALRDEDISSQRWILREQGSGTRSVFISALQAKGIVLRHSLNLTRQEAIKQSVRAGLGIGCLSNMSITEELKHGVFVRLETDLNLRRQMSIVASPMYENNRLVECFRQFLLAYPNQNKITSS